MAKSYRRKTTKRTIIKLTPKEAETIYAKEFADSKGNKHIFKLKFKPQSPTKPDFKQTSEVKYKPKEEDK